MGSYEHLLWVGVDVWEPGSYADRVQYAQYQVTTLKYYHEKYNNTKNQ